MVILGIVLFNCFVCQPLDSAVTCIQQPPILDRQLMLYSQGACVFSYGVTLKVFMFYIALGKRLTMLLHLWLQSTYYVDWEDFTAM